jgi:hypothetical protein
MALWTSEHADRPVSENPHRREAVYSAEELARADQFAAWAKANPGQGDCENPYRWRDKGADRA